MARGPKAMLHSKVPSPAPHFNFHINGTDFCVELGHFCHILPSGEKLEWPPAGHARYQNESCLPKCWGNIPKSPCTSSYSYTRIGTIYLHFETCKPLLAVNITMCFCAFTSCVSSRLLIIETRVRAIWPLPGVFLQSPVQNSSMLCILGRGEAWLSESVFSLFLKGWVICSPTEEQHLPAKKGNWGSVMLLFRGMQDRDASLCWEMLTDPLFLFLHWTVHPN